MSIEMAQALIITGIMIVFGVVLGFLAGLIWRDNRPYGAKGDYIAAIVSSVIFGLGEWFLLPVLGFGQTIRLLGTFIEVPFMSLGILWLLRYLNRNK